MPFLATTSRAEVRARGLLLSRRSSSFWSLDSLHFCFEIGGEDFAVFVVFTDAVLGYPVVPAAREWTRY